MNAKLLREPRRTERKEQALRRKMLLVTLLVTILALAPAAPALAVVEGSGGLSFSDCSFLGGRISITGPFEEDVGCVFPEGQEPFIPEAPCGPVFDDTPVLPGHTIDPFDPFCPGGRIILLF
jgi:hypothetical protein